MSARAAAVARPGLSPSAADNAWMMFFVVGVPLVLIGLWHFLPMDDYLRDTVRWIGSTGLVGIAVFTVLYVFAAVVGIPRTPMHIAAGVVFSFPVAMAVVLAGAVSAQAVTFTIARTVARDWVTRRIAQAPRVRQLLDLVEEEPFKVVFLVRLNLFIPGVLKGYGFGTTNVPFRTYMLASALGFLPIGLAHVYLGWAGGEAMLADGADFGQLEKWFIAGGVLVSVALVLAVYFYGRRALDKRYPVAGVAA